ncbi:MAG: FAD-binding oxidoreductase [Candidatus Nomurabacteria bacterium]|nr:FAD-binding oxidoreductase [Candidatus Nomurabacteria bacterium]
MKEELQKIIKGEVDDSDETLKKYSHDASIFEIRPKFVIFPKDNIDVQNLVKFINKNNDIVKNKGLHEKGDLLSITCRCAGTDMSGGAIGESIILDFTKYMNKLIEFNDSASSRQDLGLPKGLAFSQPTITVQPGMFYRDFEKITLEKGLILPCYTASKSLNAMGGMFGNNSAGERTLKYGKTEDYVVESKVVFTDGVERIIKSIPANQISNQDEYSKKIFELVKNNEEEIAEAKPKVHKNSAGYYLWNVLSSPPPLPRGRLGGGADKIFNLNKLLVGSQGTLGIATEVTFKLVKNPKYSKLVAIFMTDLEPLGRLVDEILPLNPETLETYDDKTMKLAVKFFPDFLKTKGLIGMIKFMWSFLPELGMMITGGFPKMILLVEFAGDNEEQANAQCIKLKEAIKHFNLKVHITKSDAEAGKYWDIRRESFNLLRKHVANKRTAPFIDDIIVRPEFLPKFIPELNKILGNYDITYTIAGHAGDGNFHIIPLMDFTRPDTAKIILELSDKVYDLVIRYHGSITAEHNDGIVRTPYLEKMYGERIYNLFKQTKTIFDPNNILNPGKKIGGTKEYIASHLAIEHPKPHHGV